MSEHFDDDPAEADRLAEEGAEERQRLKTAALGCVLPLAALIATLLLSFMATQLVAAGTRFVSQYRPVPDVTRSDVVAAQRAAQRAGFRVEEAPVFEGDPGELPAGVVLGQDPKAGSWGWRDEPVRLLVRRGSARVFVPEVRGLPFDKAMAKLDASGVAGEADNRRYRGDVGYHHLVVASMLPTAGALTKRGGRVDLVLKVDVAATNDWRHWEVVKARGTADCLACHSERQCSDCHVKSDGPAFPSTPSHPVTGPVGAYLLDRATEAIGRWPSGAGKPPKPHAEGPSVAAHYAVGIVAEPSADRTALLRIARWIFGVTFAERTDVSALTVDIYFGTPGPETRAMSLTMRATTAKGVRWQDVPAEGLLEVVDTPDQTELWRKQ